METPRHCLPAAESSESPDRPTNRPPVDGSAGAVDDWVARTADEVIAAAEPGKTIVCASGLSPSGAIHLGNLRELLTQHFVADEIRARGVDCEHVLFWDDYDRFRKVPAGMPDQFVEHLGKPLSAVPDPFGEYASWAEQFRAPVRAVLAELGVAVREVSQAERYAAGAYTDSIITALRYRRHINEVLARYRTKAADPATSPDTPPDTPQTDASDDSAEYFPYRVYCRSCGRDRTVITGYDDAGHLAYRCDACGCDDEFALTEENSGKLVWKVDWPMRWAYEPVTFEAAGADHSAPGSSVTVGQQLCREVFGAKPPVYLGYSFVGTRGNANLSSSAGGAPTPADALEILEPGVLRWLYARRRPRQSITVDFGTEVTRLYDEWDRLTDRAEAGSAPERELPAWERARRTSVRRMAGPRHRVSWRLLTSVVDITAGDDAQLLRVLRAVDTDSRAVTLADLEPRLGLARRWVEQHVPAAERTRVRAEPDRAALAALDEEDRASLDLLAARLEDDWTLAGLTTLVYGVPKLRRGLPVDTPPTPELKAAQRAFFALVYRLLLDRETGPRLPTLLLALGPDRLRHLLTPEPHGRHPRSAAPPPR